MQRKYVDFAKLRSTPMRGDKGYFAAGNTLARRGVLRNSSGDVMSGYAEMIYNMRLAGMTLERIAAVCGVSEDTLLRWRQQHQVIADAWHDGGELADGRVARSLYHRAIGYTHQEERLFYDSKSQEVVRAPTFKHYAPETAAAIMWLTNRMAHAWKSRASQELSGPDGEPLQPPHITVSLSSS